MTDLVAFLNARLDEDEAVAREATDGPWHQDGMSVVGRDRSYASGRDSSILVIRHTWPQEAAHIIRHDPARVLREVEAKRAILRTYEEFINPRTQEEAEIRRSLSTDVLPALAAVYSDHEGYRQEWKP